MAPLTPAQADRAVSLYAAGYSGREIADQVGATPSQVYRSLRKRGSSMRRGGAPRTTTDAQEQRVEELSKLGRSVAEIADELGVGRAAVLRVRRQRGIRARATRTAAPLGRNRVYGPEGRLVEKWCPRCGKMRPASAFYANRTDLDGVQALCKEHHREAKVQSALRSREARAEAS